MKLTRATQQAVKYACMNYHYSKSVPVNPIGYNVYNGADEWCGVITYGTGAIPNIGRPYNLPQGAILELTRVALNGKQEQTSQAVAMSLKRLHKDVPQCRLVVSYADCDQNHLGTIYQATNWIYEGLSKGDTYYIINGRKVHRRGYQGGFDYVRRHVDADVKLFRSAGKYKYLMPLDKEMKKQIQPLAKPYPKSNADWQKLDRNQFKK